MQLTTERLRTLVLAGGVLVVAALAVFLAIGRFKSPFSRRDIPKRLGIDIEQEANGVTYTQSHGGHTLFKIHASRVVQLKNDHALLHDVQIELYGADGNRVDRIQGSEFEYDQKNGTATAAGQVEMTLMRPAGAKVQPEATDKKTNAPLLTSPAQPASNGEIHVKTSGLTFDQKSGIVTTAERVDFSTVQGGGRSMGASYDSQRGFLVLDRAVELSTRRGADVVQIRAQHADFDRDTDLCDLRSAETDYRGGRAMAGDAKILFRDDGSAQRLIATGGFTLTTSTGGRLAAPAGSMDFDEHNEPRHGHLEGGVTMDSTSGARVVHGTSPAMELEFTPQGELHHAHLERGVEMRSDDVGQAVTNGQSVPVHMSRTWRSPVADVDFRNVRRGQVEPAAMRGIGGVVITGLSQRGGEHPSPSKLAADQVTCAFGPDSSLIAMTGVGHASMEQTTTTGTHATASGDRLEAYFTAADAKGEGKSSASSGIGAQQVQTAILDGHVVLTEQAAARPGAQPPPALHANAGHAVYEGAGEWLHLSEAPRVEDGGLELTADRIDVTRESGDAFAHGNVKATWTNTAAEGRASGQSSDGVAFGGQEPAHVIANEAQLHQATEEATFQGNARLWQQVNSVSGPVIVLDRRKQTLVVRSIDIANPVQAVLVSAGSAAQGKRTVAAAGKPPAPSVIRVRGGDLWYSNMERRAVMHGGILGAVTAETGAATTTSNDVELELAPAASHANGQAQVERMTAAGHVVVSSQGRHGIGEKLVYTGADSNYILTGTAAVPPRLTDPQRGSVTGTALIFDSRDDSVSIEGHGHETTTETRAPELRKSSSKAQP